jgi:hypothetical protein
MERRHKRISTNVEDLVWDIMTTQVIGKEDITMSDYLRALIIRDLDKRHLLPALAKDTLLVGVANVELELEGVA